MSILDFFYPKRCVGCGRVGTYFCASCLGESKPHFPQVCPVCEKPSVDGVRHKRCQVGYDPDGLFVIWQYEGVPRKIIHKLKYKFLSDMGLSLASASAGALKSWQRSSPNAPVWSQEKFIVVPIPLHWWRGNWRGFNQAQSISGLLAQLMGWRMAPLLRRKKWTKTQVGLKAKQRKENIEGAFEVAQSSNHLINKSTNILIFDDVWTSGSTMREATRVLKKAAFTRVWCLTLAR